MAEKTADQLIPEQIEAPNIVQLEAVLIKHQRRRNRIGSLLVIVSVLSVALGFVVLTDTFGEHDFIIKPKVLPQAANLSPRESATKATDALEQQLTQLVQFTEQQQALLSSQIHAQAVPEKGIVEPLNNASPSDVANVSTIKVSVHDSVTDGLSGNIFINKLWLLIEQGQLKRALAALNHAPVAAIHKEEKIRLLASIASAQQNFHQARRYYQQLLQLQPNDPSATLELLLLPAIAGEQEEKELALRQAISDSPTNDRLYQALGQLMVQQKRWHQAEVLFFKAHSLAARNPSHLLNLALLCEQLNQGVKAQYYYRRLLSLNPRHQPRRNVIEQHLAVLIAKGDK